MLKATIGRDELQTLIGAMSNLDLARFLYCQEMAGTHLAVGEFENMLILVMHMCDRIKLPKVLGPDEDAWKRAAANKAQLEGSTLGSVIKTLERNKMRQADIAYLRWIKNKRDYFVHQLFH